LPFGYQLRRAQYAYRQALERALEPTGVTAPQFAAMALLQATPGLSNAELARQSLVTPQTMNVIVGRLEAAGLVVRSPHAAHGRILRARLTARGETKLDACFARAAAVEGCLVGALQPADHLTLLATLTRIGDALVALSHD
jgi:DNA-binding MarR family transcriptional regulator